MAARLRVTQTKSTINHIQRNRATIRALGLGRIGSTVDVPDNDATRGMVRQVRFLVSLEEIDEAQPGRSRSTARTKSDEDARDAEKKAPTAEKKAPTGAKKAPAGENGNAGEETSS
jgi:large subunit ribosomal protein L30